MKIIKKNEMVNKKIDKGVDIPEMIKIIKLGKKIRKIDGPKFYGSALFGC